MNFEDILQSVDQAERYNFNLQSTQAPGKSTPRQPEDIWLSNPLVSQQAFNLSEKSLLYHFLNEKNFDLPENLRNSFRVLNDTRSISEIDKLLECQDNFTDSSTLDLKSPAEHLKMLKNFERKCQVVAFQDAIKEMESFMRELGDFSKLLMCQLLQRQLEPPLSLLHTQRNRDGHFTDHPNLAKKMEQLRDSGKDIFRKSTFEEQMLASALSNLTLNKIETEVEGAVLQLKNILDVYLTSLDKTGYKIEESFSQAQMQILSAGERINSRLQAHGKTNPESVLQGMLILAILTGDVLHLLTAIRSCQELSASQASLDVADLLALLIVIAKKVYLESPLKKQFDQNSAFLGLNSAKLTEYGVHRDSYPVFSYDPSKVLWDGQFIYAVHKNLRLTKYNGQPGSINFGNQIATIPLKALPKSIMLSEDPETGENRISLICKNNKFGSLQPMVFTLSSWDDLFDGLLAYVNKTVLANNWNLLDIGICPQTVEEGGKAIAYVLFDKTHNPSNGRQLQVIRRKSQDESWADSFEWIRKTTKSVANRFFKHHYSPQGAKDKVYTWMAVWCWSTQQTDAASDDIQVDYFRDYYWANVLIKTQDFAKSDLQGRRILDVKGQSCANGGDALTSIVSVKDPNSECSLIIDRENIVGSVQQVAQKVLEKMLKCDPETFVSASICPRDTSKNDSKVAFYAYSKQFAQKITDQKPLCDFKQHIMHGPSLDQAFFDQVLAYVNDNLLASGQINLVDIGFTNQVREEGGQAVAFIVFEEKAQTVASRLAVDLMTQNSSWKTTLESLNQQIKTAGQRFFRHGYSPKLNLDDKVTAVFYWADLNQAESDYQLHYVEKYAWNDTISELENMSLTLNNRQIVDVKISAHQNALASFVSKKADRPISCELKMNFQKYQATFADLIARVPNKAKEKRQGNFAGLGMCPRDPQKNDEKVIISAHIYELEQFKQTQFVERVLSASDLSLVMEKDYLDYPAGLEEFTALKLDDDQAYLGFENQKMVLVQDGKRIELQSPLKFVKEALKSVQDCSGILALQFDTHIVTYAIKAIRESGLAYLPCSPCGFKEINKKNARTLFLRDKSCEFFYLKTDGTSLCFDQLDDLLDPNLNLEQYMPSQKLRDYAKTLITICKKVQGGLQFVKEQDHFQDFQSKFRTGSNQKDPKPSLSCLELATVLIELIFRFNEMQQSKAIEGRLEGMLLLQSPFVRSQSASVLEILLSLDNQLDACSQVKLKRVLIDHLLAFRQDSSDLPAIIANQADFGTKLLQKLIQLASSVDQMQESQQKSQTKREFDECYVRFLSLTKEYVKFAELQSPKQFPAVCPEMKVTSSYKPFDYDLPQNFIDSATERIKLRQIKSFHNNVDFHTVKFVLWNGVQEFETIQFGTNNSLSVYNIKNDRSWTRQYWYKINNDDRWPFAQMNFTFDGQRKGCFYSDNTVKHCQVTDDMAENEIIVGFRGYLDKETNMLRSISMKTAIMPKKLTSSPLISYSQHQLAQVQFSQLLPRERFIASLINSQLPYRIEKPSVMGDQFDQEIIQFIQDKFNEQPGTESYNIALKFALNLATKALRSNEKQLGGIQTLFEAALKAQIANPQFNDEQICGRILQISSFTLMIINHEELTKYALSHFRQLTEINADQSHRDKFAKLPVFKLFSFLTCIKSQHLLVAAPEPIPSHPNEQTNYQMVIVEQINKSDLLSGGLELKYMGICSEKTLANIKYLQQYTNIPMLEGFELKPFDNEIKSCKVCQAIINEGEIARIDQIVLALQQVLQSDPFFRMKAIVGGALGFKLTRSAFAVMVKFSGLQLTLQGLGELLDLEEESVMIPKEKNAREQAIREIIQDDVAYPKLIKLWKNATEMRTWLSQEKKRIAADVELKIPMQEVQLTDQEKFGLDQTEVEAAERIKNDHEHERVIGMRDEEETSLLQKVLASIEEKANFLIKLETPEFFKAIEPDPEEQYSTFFTNYPSYFKSDLKQQASVDSSSSTQSLWRRKYSEWKNHLSEQSNFLSKQEKLAEVRESGTTSVLACLQTTISAQQIQDRVELNFTNAARRLVGLSLLDDLLRFLLSLGGCSIDRNVSLVIYYLCQSLQTSPDRLFHYLDGVAGCSNFLENQLRQTFFGLLAQLLRYLDSKKSVSMEMFPCYSWNFKARDFKFLIKLKMIKRLMWGQEKNGIFGHLGNKQHLDVQAIDPVLKIHLTFPKEKEAKTLLFTFMDLFLGILARLAEESEKREHVSISERQVHQIQKSMSVIDTSECQILLSQAFDIIFREFELFLEVSKEIGSFLEEIGNNASQLSSLINVSIEMIQHLNKKRYLEKHPKASYAQEPIQIIEQIETSKTVLEQVKVHQENGSIAEEESELFAGLFNIEEVTVIEAKPAPAQVKIEVTQVQKQKLTNQYRAEFQKARLQRLLSLIVIFVNIATASPYPLQLLQNVANPVHIQTLIKLFVEVTPLMKIQILHILRNLLLIKIPREVFSSGLAGIQSQFKTQVTFKNSLAQVLYQFAVQIRSGDWKSTYESTTGGMYDVLVHLTHTIALCLKEDQIVAGASCSEELSAAFERINCYPSEERDVLFHIIGAHFQRFVHKDRILNVHDKKVSRFDRTEVNDFGVQKYQGFIVCPEKNDAHLQLKLSKNAISALIQSILLDHPLEEESKRESPVDKELDSAVFKGNVMKLLCLQINSDKNSQETLLDSKERQMLISYLLKEGAEAVELSSQQIEAFKSESQRAAAQQTTSYLELLLNYYQTQSYDSYTMQQETQKDSKSDQEQSIQIEAIFSELEAKKDDELTPQVRVPKNQAKQQKKLQTRMTNYNKFKKPDEKPNAQQINTKRALIGSIFSKINGRAQVTQEEIAMLSAKVCDFIDLSGVTLPEIIFGVCLSEHSQQSIENAKSAYIIKLEEVLNQINQEFAGKSDCKANAFRQEQMLVDFLLDKLNNSFQVFTLEQFDAKLAAIDLAQLRSFLGPQIQELHTKIKQAIFRRLTEFNKLKVDQAIEQILTQVDLKVASLEGAQNMFAKRQQSYKQFQKFLETTQINHIAQSFKAQLASKLLFQIVQPYEDISSKDGDSKVVESVKLLTVLLNHYANATAQLKRNQNVDCIWECRFKPHILKELKLYKLQSETASSQSGQLYEGSEQNIHQVLACVCYPTTDELNQRLLGILSVCQQTQNGCELVRRLIQNQIIDKFIARCMKDKNYANAKQACFDALRPTQLAEGGRLSKKEEQYAITEIREEVSGTWQLCEQTQDQLLLLRLQTDLTVDAYEVNGNQKQGNWLLLSTTSLEITVGDWRYVFELNKDLKICQCANKEGLYLKRMMDPSQFYGEWNWCHDGISRNCELILNDQRGGQSEGSPQTYWYLNPDYTVMIGRLNRDDEHIFKVVDDNTLEIIKPQRNPPTRCIRVSQVPPRQKPILQTHQLFGEWNWCHNPTDPTNRTPHLLVANGSIESQESKNGKWKIEPDGHIFIGRLSDHDRHIFRVIDKNTLECIEPKRNPPTQMQRVGKALKNPCQQDQLNLTAREIQVNSLAISLLLTQQPTQFDFWLEILPQLFEMLLFQLSLNCSKSKVRMILEQAQIILNFAYENADVLAKSGLLQVLLKSPLLEQYLKTSKVNQSKDNLSLLLFADLKVQQIQCSERVNQKNLTELPGPGPIRQTVDLLFKLRKQFGDNKLTFQDKKNFIIEYGSSLPKLACWSSSFKVNSHDQNQDGVHTIDLSKHGPFSSFKVKITPDIVGNPDRVIQIKHGTNSVMKNLQDSYEFATDTLTFSINFNVLPKRYAIGVYQSVNQNALKLVTSKDQLIKSFKSQIDQVICSTDLGVYYWCKDYTEVKQLHLQEKLQSVALPEECKQLLSAPRYEGWRPPSLKLQEYFKRRLCLLNGQMYISDEQQLNMQKLDVGGQKVKDFCASKNTALFITENGELFTSGLTNLADGKSEGQLEIKKIVDSLFADLSENVRFRRCWIQSNDPKQQDSNTGYAFVEVLLQGEQRLKLFSFGVNQYGCLGNGLEAKGNPTPIFTPLVYDSQENYFEQIFLSPQLALAVDIMGVLWLLGGKAQFKDEVYFPSSFTEINNFPLKTALLEQLQMQFGLQTLLTCRKVVVADQQILLLLNAKNLDEAREYPLCYQIQQFSGDANACSLKLLTFVDQTVIDIDNYASGALLLVERATTFNQDYSLNLSVEPCFEKCITQENCEQIISSVQSDWEAFVEKIQNAFETQFVFDVLECINKQVALEQSDFSEESLQKIQVKKIELQGESFQTEEDRRLARVIIPKLVQLNIYTAVIYESKLNTTFEADPFSLISPAMGLPTACRNWNAILKNQKRFLCDKALEQQFLNLIKDLPVSERGRIEITINRYAARRFCDSGKVDLGDGETVFTQIMRAIKSADPQFTSWRKKEINSAVFRANFLHEGSIDAGGPYREAHEQMCREVLTGALPLLIPTENQRTNDGEMREAFVLNHNSISVKELQLFFQMGCWIGNAIRTGSPLTLSLHPVFWKKVVGADSFTLRDLKLCSIHEFNQIDFVREASTHSANNDDFQAIVDQNFTVTYGGNTIELCANGYSKKVTLQNHMDYVRLAVNALLRKDDLQIAEVKRGIHHVLSKQAIESCSWKFAEERACGKQTIDVQILRQNTSFSSSFKSKKVDGQAYEEVFWKVLSEFSEENKRLYMKFVTGRSKLPLDIKKQSYPHTVTTMGGNNATLPQAHICYNQIDMPPYTTEQAMRQRLLTAIQFCGEVDTDGVRHADY